MEQLNNILIFEGIDKTGKSSIMDLMKNEGIEQMMVHRLFISNLVYDEYYCRSIDHWKYIKNLMKLLVNNVIVVYTKCNYLVYTSRCMRLGHDILDEEEFNEQLKLFDKHLKASKFHVITLDTSHVNIIDTFNELLTELKMYGNNRKN